MTDTRDKRPMLTNSEKYQESTLPGVPAPVVISRYSTASNSGFNSSIHSSGSGAFGASRSGTGFPGADSTTRRTLNSTIGGFATNSSSNNKVSPQRMQTAEAVEEATSELATYRRLFNAFDADHSGGLTLEELHYMLLCLGVSPDDDDVLADLHDTFDDDGNGTLEFDEFVDFMLEADLDRKRTAASVEERTHVTHLSSWRFAHNTRWRIAWDTTILFITFYYVLRSAFEAYRAQPLTMWEVLLEVLISLVLVADVGVFSNSAFQDENGKTIDGVKEVLYKYLTSTLLFDLLGALPFDLIYIAADPSNYATSGMFLVLRLARWLRVVRVRTTLFLPYSLTGHLTPRFVYFMYHVAPVLKALFYAVTFIHTLTIGWLVVVNDPLRVSYIDALYLVLYTVSTVGYGDAFIITQGQRLYCCMMFVMGIMMNGIVISQMSVFLSNADIVTERKDKMRETLAVLSHFDIPEDTQSEILSFQNHLLEHNLGSSHQDLVAGLPRSIRDNLGLFRIIKYISSVPMFGAASHNCKVALARCLINIVFQPQQFIIIAGEEGKEMYFLGHGVADVILPKGTYIATLLKGNFFGEIALLVDGAKRTASIKALTYCDVFRLEKRDFTDILNKYPAFRESVKVLMEERVAQFQEGQQKAKVAEAQKKEKAQVLKSGGQSQTLSAAGGSQTMQQSVRSTRPSTNGSVISSTAGGDGNSMVDFRQARRRQPARNEPLVELKPELLSAVEENNVVRFLGIPMTEAPNGLDATEKSSFSKMSVFPWQPNYPPPPPPPPEVQPVANITQVESVNTSLQGTPTHEKTVPHGFDDRSSHGGESSSQQPVSQELLPLLPEHNGEVQSPLVLLSTDSPQSTSPTHGSMNM